MDAERVEDIVYYYDASKNPDAEFYPGIPLGNVTKAWYEQMTEQEQKTLESCSWYTKTEPEELARRRAARQEAARARAATTASGSTGGSTGGSTATDEASGEAQTQEQPVDSATPANVGEAEAGGTSASGDSGDSGDMGEATARTARRAAGGREG